MRFVLLLFGVMFGFYYLCNHIHTNNLFKLKQHEKDDLPDDSSHRNTGIQCL